MLDVQLPKAQILAAHVEEFIRAANEDTQKGVDYLMLQALPRADHATKLSALPDFIRATITQLGGPQSEIFNETISGMLQRIPITESGDEISVIDAIRKTHNFLSHNKI